MAEKLSEKKIAKKKPKIFKVKRKSERFVAKSLSNFCLSENNRKLRISEECDFVMENSENPPFS